jgi:PAS domain S-box-containing protein
MNEKLPGQNPLRAAAEARLEHTLSTEARHLPIPELLHELEVHQIELEMQNENLRCAQTTLEESRDRYVDLYEFAPVGYLTLTSIGQIAEINLTGAALLGVARPKLLQQRFDLFITPEDRDRWHVFSASVMKSAEKCGVDLALRRDDGSTFHAHLDCLRVQDDAASAGVRPEGSIPPQRKSPGGIGLRVALTDVSAEEMNKELERRVADRTAQLRFANKEIESFAYSVSHDLRAPLRHIDGFLEQLKEKIAPTLDEESRHYMAVISGAALRMATLIDDLLSFSRMSLSEMAKTQVGLGVLVQDVIRELEPETRDRVIDWRIADLPVVTGDRAMLRITLFNMIANALKFTHTRAKAKIEIGCQPGAATETVVFVRDNGVGFDMQYADKLFGVFERLHGADEFEGTGIGLANVRRVIDRHGGRTWAEGKVDGGATFYFSLPRGEMPADSSIS